VKQFIPAIVTNTITRVVNALGLKPSDGTEELCNEAICEFANLNLRPAIELPECSPGPFGMTRAEVEAALRSLQDTQHTGEEQS